MNDKIKNQIINTYIKEKDVEKMIRNLNISERDIRKILKENNIDRSYHNFSDELYQRIIKLYSDGKTYEYIQNTLHISANGIKKTLRRNNIPFRTYSQNNRRFDRNQYYFDNIDTPNKAYVLGLIYADGCNHTEHNSITINLQKEDRDVLVAIKTDMQYEGSIKERFDGNINHKHQCILCINDEYLSNRLNNLGVVNAKSLVLKFPSYLKDDLLPHFIRGYFDGDGCIWNNDKLKRTEVQIVGTNEFCQSLSNILISKDIKCSIVYPKKSRETNSNTRVLHITGSRTCFRFLTWIYNNSEIKMYRKYQKYLYMCENYNIGIKSIID